MGSSFDKPISALSFFALCYSAGAEDHSARFNRCEGKKDRSAICGLTGLQCFLLWLLAERQNTSFAFFHRNMAFENRAVPDNQTLRGDVADNRARRLHFELFFRHDISHDLALNKDGCCGDFALDGCLLSHCEMGLTDDFAFHLAIDGGLAVELQRIDAEVDWNLEMGAITRRVYDLGAPAALFENVRGYPKGFRALGAPLGSSKRPGHGLFARTALAMHMPPTSSAQEIMSNYLKRKEKLIPPILVKSGPCKDNIDLADAVDVLKFPIPLIHGGDGGRYIGTWHTVITKDPDSSWVNWGMYRLMVHDRNTLGCLFPAQQHIGQIYQKYELQNKPMPVAVAIGGQPVIPLVSCVMLPPYVNEVEVAGALQGAPIPLVKCETVDLEVPASAEIVIEGEVLPHERRVEGPFGEYMGYEAGKSSPKPILKIKAITYRNSPILPFSNMGMPVHEGQTATALIKGAEIYAELKRLGLPVKGVFCPPYGVGHMC